MTWSFTSQPTRTCDSGKHRQTCTSTKASLQHITSLKRCDRTTSRRSSSLQAPLSMGKLLNLPFPRPTDRPFPSQCTEQGNLGQKDSSVHSVAPLTSKPGCIDSPMSLEHEAPM